MSDTSLVTFPEEGSREYQGLLYAYAHLSTPVALINANGKWLYANPAALDFLAIDSINELSGIIADDWGGRLAPIDAPNSITSQTDASRYFKDVKTARIFYRRERLLTKENGKTVKLETLHDVTALYEGDEQAQIMIDAAPLCCNYWNGNLENIACNLEAVKLFDLPDKKTYLDRFRDLSPELQPNGRKSSDEAVRHINNAFKEGFDRFEWMHQKLNGEPVPAEITLVKVQTSGGDVVLGYTRDLRSTKLAPEVDDIEWMTNIFNSLPFPIGVAGASGKWAFMNKAGLDMLEIGAERLGEVTSVDWNGRLEPLPPDDAGDVSHYIDNRAKKIYTRIVSPLKDSFGGLVGRVETLQDLTRQYETEERMRAMIDATPLCYNVWNRDFENIECNMEAVKLFDLPDKKSYLDNFFRLSPEYQPNGNKSADEAHKNITYAFEHGLTRFKWMHQKLNGEPVPAEITLIRVKLRREGDVVLGYTRDLRGVEQ